MRKSGLKKFLVCFIALSLAFAAAGCSGFGRTNSNNADLADSVAAANSVEIAKGSSDRTAMPQVDAVAAVRRSVVAIRMMQSKNSTTATYGSGVFVDMGVKDEKNDNVFYILTCHHVVSEKGLITVYIPDAECDNFGESDYNSDYVFEGEIGNGKFGGAVSLIGGDEASDVAVIKLDISGSKLSPSDIVAVKVPPENGYAPAVGEEVFAIGNPTGTLPGTATFGRIGYINRETIIADVGELTLYQINVDIYHGSSGGALFSLYGELIGITNAGSDEYSGVNYAIPYMVNSFGDPEDMGFCNVAAQLLGTYSGRNYGYVSGRKVKIGISIKESSDGVTVAEVTAGSLAAAGGIKVNDIIVGVSVGGGATMNIGDLDDLSEALDKAKPGDVIKFKLRRQIMFQYADAEVDVTCKQYIFCDTGV